MAGPPQSDEAVVDIESHCLVSLSEAMQVSLGSNRKLTGETSRSSSRGGELLETAGVVPENILVPSSVMNSSCAEPCSEAEEDLPALNNYVSKLEDRVARLESEKDLLNHEVLRLDSINLCLSAQNKELKNQIGINRIALQRRNNLLLQARLRLRDLVRQVDRISTEVGPPSPTIKLESQPLRKRSAGRTIARSIGRPTPPVLMPRQRMHRGQMEENDPQQASGSGQISDEEPEREAVKEISTRKSRRSECTGHSSSLGTSRHRHVAQNSSRTRQKREASQAPAKAYEAALSERNQRSSHLTGSRQDSSNRGRTENLSVNGASEGGVALRGLSPGLSRTSLPPLTEVAAREQTLTEVHRRQPGQPLSLLPRETPLNLHRFASTPAEKALFDRMSKATHEPHRSGKLEKYLSKARPSSRRQANELPGAESANGWASDARSRSASACKTSNGDSAVVPCTVGPAPTQSETVQRAYPPSLQLLSATLPQFARPATKSANFSAYGKFDGTRNAYPAGLAEHRVYPLFGAAMKSPKNEGQTRGNSLLI